MGDININYLKDVSAAEEVGDSCVSDNYESNLAIMI